MGNPILRPDVFRKIGAAPPPTAIPPQFPELRQCSICTHCQELRPVISPERFMAICEWQGQWWWPLKGCDQWVFDPAALGDDGLS